MMYRVFSPIAAALLIWGSPGVHAQVALEIDGQSAVPAGAIDSINYLPSSRQLVLRSVHQDWRCSADPAENTPAVQEGDFRLVLDQVNPDTEGDAVYRIASPEGGGSITQNLSEGKIVVQTSSDTAVQLSCAPFRASFYSSDFENPFVASADTPPSPFTAGSQLTIPFTVRNTSNSLVATDVSVDFTWSADGIDAPVLDDPEGDEIITELVAGTKTWTIEALFPGESRVINVIYDIGADTPSGTVVTTEATISGAMDRAGQSPVSVGNPPAEVSEVTIGEASGDLAASIQVNDPVAGSGSENVLLSYRITNNAAIDMTGIEATLDPPSIPAGVSSGSTSAAVGTVSGDQWSISLLESGQTGSVDQTFTAAADAAAGAEVCGLFTIDSADQTLVDTGDDGANGCATIRREVDVSSNSFVVEPSFGATTVDAGEPFAVGLQLQNAGPSNAGSVTANVTLSVDPEDANIVILGAPDSTSNNGTLSGSGSSILFSVSGELVPNETTASAEIAVEIPATTADQTSVCLDVLAASDGSETETNPSNNSSGPTCILVANSDV